MERQIVLENGGSPYMMASTMAEALKRSFYFRALPAEQLTALAGITRAVRYDAGELVFLDGEEATAFYVILEGQVQVYKISPKGSEMILHLLGPGEIFAEVPVFGDIKTYPANALCLKPTELLAIDGDGFRRLAEEHPKILLNILILFAKRLREFNALIEDLSLRSVDSRLAKYLLSVSKQTPDQARIKVHKKTLAAILGTIPETLSRCFKRLSGEGIIAVRGSEVAILKRSALQRIASQGEIGA